MPTLNEFKLSVDRLNGGLTENILHVDQGVFAMRLPICDCVTDQFYPILEHRSNEEQIGSKNLEVSQRTSQASSAMGVHHDAIIKGGASTTASCG